MNISHIPYESLGKADFGWLKANHHFSFGHYLNRNRMGFGKLLVINDDLIAPGAGFDPHPHREMEIITFVRKGAITHKDSNGNQGRTEAGNVQVMSAGTGVIHSEYNHESNETSIYQIWIQPNKRGVAPRWDTREFPKENIDDHLPALVSGRQEEVANGALLIYQDTTIFGGKVKQGTIIKQPLKHNGYLLVSSGEIQVEGLILRKGDGAEIRDTEIVSFKAKENSEILVIDTL